jgi:hypothetical protein
VGQESVDRVREGPSWGRGELEFNNVEARRGFQCCKARQVWKARKEKSEAGAAAAEEAADAGVCDFTTAHHAASFVCQCIRH